MRLLLSINHHSSQTDSCKANTPTPHAYNISSEKCSKAFLTAKCETAALMHHSSSVSHTSEKPRAMCIFSYNIFMNTGQDLISGLYGRTSCLFRNKEMMSASGRLHSTVHVKVFIVFFLPLVFASSFQVQF